MARIGCLLLLIALGLAAIELYVYLVVAQWTHAHVESINGYLEPIILMVIDGVIGVKIVQGSIARLPMAMLAGGAGKLMVRVAAGMLLAFPGLASDVLALLLLIPGLDRVFGRLGDKVAASVMRRSMQKMFGGGKMPAGFPPGAGGFPFPGMKPDERIGRGPKTYDTTAEKDPPT